MFGLFTISRISLLVLMWFSFDVKTLQIFFGCRRHYLECPHGLLGKHIEKLVQCDPRLNFLSQQAEMTLDSPYFESQMSGFEDTHERDRELDLNNEGSPNFIDYTSPSGAQCSSKSKQDPRPLECIHQEKPSPRSGNYVFYLRSAFKFS